MTEALDVRRTVRGLVGGWYWILGAAIAGGVVGLLLGNTEAPKYRARSAVIFPPSAVDNQGRFLRNMETEAAVALSSDVLDAAGARLDPPRSGASVRSMVTARAVTTEVLRVQASAPSGLLAADAANAVADEYVTYLNGTSSENTRVLLDGLTAQINELEATIARLGGEISGGVELLAGLGRSSAEAARQVALLDSLRAEQVEAARQLSSAKSRMADARLTENLNRRGTRVLETAVVPSRPISPQPRRTAVAGIAVGALLGVAVALLRARGDGRLRRRADIARATGAPVIGSLEAPRRVGVRQLRALLDDAKPTPRERLAARTILESLGMEAEHQPVDLVIVCLPGDHAAPYVAAKLAAVVAAMHLQTTLRVGADEPTTAALRSALAIGNPEDRFLTTDQREIDDHPRGAEVMITVGVAVGRSLPEAGAESRYVLALSAGFATADEVATAALACIDAGARVAGVLVANPDPDDQTTGTSLPAPKPTHPPPTHGRRRRAAVEDVFG